MTLTEIEQYDFAVIMLIFVAAFDFDDECISVSLTPVENENDLPGKS